MLALQAPPPSERALAVLPPPPPPPFDEDDANIQVESSIDDLVSDDSVPKAPETKTLSDFAQEVTNWTLHSDRDLHSYLKRFSADLFARTKDLDDSVRNIALEADSAHVRLKNTLNAFLLLSNNQFIENRVYDEEQEDFMITDDSSVELKTQQEENEHERTEPNNGGMEPKENTKATAASIVNKYRSALEMGFEAMKLFVMMDEEEDDERDASSPFETVLDIYNERPLPFIIGTRDFLEDDTLGLGAAPEEDFESDSSDASSDSSSSFESDSTSDSNSSSGTRRSIPRDDRSSSDESASVSRYRMHSDESDTSGLFGHVVRDEVSLRERVDSDDESDTSGLFGRLVESKAQSSRGVAWNDSDASESMRERDKDVLKSRNKRGSRRGREDVLPPFEASTTHRNPPFLDSSDDESVAPFSKQSHRNKSNVANSLDSSSSDDDEGFKPERLESTRSTKVALTQGFRLPPMNERTSRRSKAGSVASSDSDAESTTSGLFGRPVLEPKRMAPVAVVDYSRADDSSEDDKTKDLFASVKAKPWTPKMASATPRQLVSRRSSGSSSSDNESKEEGVLNAPPTALGSRSQPVSRRPLSGLLNGNESDDSTGSGGLFGIRQSSSSNVPVSKLSREVLHTLSDSDSDDEGLFGATTTASKPTIVSPVVKKSTPFQTKSTDVQSESSDSDDSGLFGAPNAHTEFKPQPLTASMPAIMPPRPMMNQTSVSDNSEDSSDDDGGLFGTAASKPVMARNSTELNTVLNPVATSVLPIVQPPLPSAIGRMQVASSDSDSDWESDGDLFGSSTLK
ncbi:hypothetical protein CCR75_004348 [Bremia lactucae]|uniref:WASH complex subunit FAM21 n=1 Tax=Bremia lactucae TaxID=4779 RepID=A0A976IDV9_BRELC|nr:hypothetical protein CCR75_004348 [Bremia lactucae]